MRPEKPTREELMRQRTFREDVVAWVLLIVLGGGAIVGWQVWSHRTILVASTPAEGAPDPRITVLAFDRVVKQSDGAHLGVARLEEHLAALARAGFQPVALHQLADFYARRGPLPARPVVLTFDHGYLSTAAVVDPLLRERRWPATLFVMTERQSRRDPFFVYWPRLRQMVDSGIWEVGSHGHQGHTPVRVDAEGNEGPFFIRRAWRPEENRVESQEEFAQRVAEDHRQGREELEAQSGRPVAAYAAPLRDMAVASLDPELQEVHERIVRDSYPLAFVDDPFGVNDRRSDPHHLRRLRVRPYWSASELLQRLQHALAPPVAQEPADPRGEPSAAAWATHDPRDRDWVPVSGHLQLSGETLEVGGRGRADLWRAGSQWADDWILETRVWIDDGQFWVVQPAQDLTEEWRWGGDRHGTHLQRRGPGRAAETLASFPATIEPQRWHDLRIVRRGSGIWIEWDGQPIAERPVYLPGRWRGSVGCVTWARAAAGLRLERPRFRALPYEARALSAAPDEQEVQAAIQEAPALAALAPAWFEAHAGGLREAPGDRDLLMILSRRYGFDVTPTVRVSGEGATALERWLPQALERAQAAGWAGLRLDISDLTPTRRSDVMARAERVSRSAGWDGRPLLYATGAREGAEGSR
jgi:peptidoglycan/xylan/chitin deacetylase (PgdA/CDA1 family)